MKRIKRNTPKKLWRLETVCVGEGCLPTRLALSSALRTDGNDSSVTEYLMKHRHVMCKTHFKCLNHAGDEDWDGFDCRNCPRAEDSNNRLSPSEILDTTKDLLVLHKMVHFANLEPFQPPPVSDS